MPSGEVFGQGGGAAVKTKVYEVSGKEQNRLQTCDEYHEGIFGCLKKDDEQVYHLINREDERLRHTLQLIAAENRCSRAVLAALGSVMQNKTAEGYPGARLHGGSEVVDDVERLAVRRAMEAFGAQYANVQPHCGTGANQIVLTAILEQGDRILSMGLEQGGHFSHGAVVSFTGKYFEAQSYHLDKKSYTLDYDAIRETAKKFKPKLIICGASAYTRTIDFEKFRQIADEVGAYLMADISHISGLVAAGAHPSPIDYAHFTTTSTYKPGGPRGGLVLMGKDKDKRVVVGGREAALWELIDSTAFPGMQGTPSFNNIAAKAVFFKEMISEEYEDRQFRIVENAKTLANKMRELGWDIVTGGTDNHMVLVNVSNSRTGLTGVIAQKSLEDCGIVVNMIRLPYDKRDVATASGIRLGTPIVTKNGMGEEEMEQVAVLTDTVLNEVEIISGSEYRLSEHFREKMQDEVDQLCCRFPIN